VRSDSGSRSAAMQLRFTPWKRPADCRSPEPGDKSPGVSFPRELRCSCSGPNQSAQKISRAAFSFARPGPDVCTSISVGNVISPPQLHPSKMDGPDHFRQKTVRESPDLCPDRRLPYMDYTRATMSVPCATCGRPRRQPRSSCPNASKVSHFSFVLPFLTGERSPIKQH
jgi:hypothetical protein